MKIYHIDFIYDIKEQYQLDIVVYTCFYKLCVTAKFPNNDISFVKKHEESVHDKNVKLSKVFSKCKYGYSKIRT